MDNKHLEKILAYKAGLAKLAAEPIKSENYTSPLSDDVMKVASKPIKDTTKNVIKGVTEHINTNEAQKVIGGDMFKNKIAKILESRAAAKAAKLAGEAGGALKSVGKHIPMLGGLAVGLGTALATGDASAAVPVLNEADSLGPEAGSLEHKLESGTITPEEMEILRNRSMSGR